MPEKPKETGTEMLARMDHALNCEVLLTHDFQPRPPYKINPHPCQRCKLATFLSRLRELSAEFRGKVVNVKSGYWKDKPTEMTKKYKEIADTLDALLGERVTGGEKGQ